MSPAEQVKKYYPNANVSMIPTTNDKTYYYIIDGDSVLGKGKSKKAAWKAASRNIDK